MPAAAAEIEEAGRKSTEVKSYFKKCVGACVRARALTRMPSCGRGP